MAIVYDDPKRETNIKTHGLDFADAKARFVLEDSVIVPIITVAF